MAKSADAFRTISEVADHLDTPAHVLRFWESKFTQIKPVKRAGGRRYYRPADMALLGGIKKLLHDDGMTIKGVQKILREKGVRFVSKLSGDLEEDEFEHDLVPLIEVEVPPETASVLPFSPRAPEPEAKPPVKESKASEPKVEAEVADAGSSDVSDADVLEADETESVEAPVEAKVPDKRDEDAPVVAAEPDVAKEQEPEPVSEAEAEPEPASTLPGFLVKPDVAADADADDNTDDPSDETVTESEPSALPGFLTQASQPEPSQDTATLPSFLSRAAQEPKDAESEETGSTADPVEASDLPSFLTKPLDFTEDDEDTSETDETAPELEITPLDPMPTWPSVLRAARMRSAPLPADATAHIAALRQWVYRQQSQ